MSDKNWKELLGIDSDKVEDIRFVGYAYIKEGQYETALSFFEALVVLNPTSAYDLQTLGALYLQTGDNMAALNYLDRALKVDSEHLPTLLNRAKALFTLGYAPQAIAQARALTEAPDQSIANSAEALLLAYT